MRRTVEILFRGEWYRGIVFYEIGPGLNYWDVEDIAEQMRAPNGGRFWAYLSEDDPDHEAVREAILAAWHEQKESMHTSGGF